MFPNAQDSWSPGDWPESLPELRTIDNLMRCSICFEYFQTAVIIPECSHNYCSLCIRRAISYQAHCPTCHVKASQQDLKCNRVLDEFVKNFVNMREKLLKMLSGSKDNECHILSAPISKASRTPSSKFKGLSCSKGKEKRPSRQTPNRKTKRRKIIVDSDDDMEMDDEMQIKKDPDWSEKDDTSRSQKNEQKTTDTVVRPPDYAECPVCGELIQQSKINSHLDICLTRGEKKESLRNKGETPPHKESNPKEETLVPGTSGFKSPPMTSTQRTTKLGSNSFISAKQKRKPLPKLVYTLLSDKQLKQKLKEVGLPAQGAREKLIKRHKEFVTRYNAQCDSANPKSAAIIIREMEHNEKIKIKLSKTSSTESTLPSFTKKSSEDDIEAARKQYLKENQNHFDSLIDQIKSRRNAKSSKNSNKAQESNKDEEELNVMQPETEDAMVIDENNADEKRKRLFCETEVSSSRDAGDLKPNEASEQSRDMLLGNKQGDFVKESTENSVDFIEISSSSDKPCNDSTNAPLGISEDLEDNPFTFGVAPDCKESADCKEEGPWDDGDQLSPEGDSDEEAELTPSLGLTSDEEGESEEDAYSLHTSPVVNIQSKST